MNTCYIYMRTASQKQFGNNSIGSQHSLCRGYAINHDYQVLDTFRDEGVSGNSLHRKGLQQLLKSAKEHPVDAIIVSKVDRLARSTAVFMKISKSFQKLGIELVSVAEGNLKSNKLLLTLVVSIAEFEDAMNDDK